MKKIYLNSSVAIPGHGRIISALHFFTDIIQDYWHFVYPQIQGYQLSPKNRNYFYDVSLKATRFKGSFSENGIYLFEGYDGKQCLHTLEIAQYALACMQAHSNTGEGRWLDVAGRQLQHLMKEMDEGGMLHTEHRNPIYSDISTGWRSALTQAFFISAGIRFFLITKSESILSHVILAADGLTREYEMGGCRRHLNAGCYIYEEYPRQNLSGVLNGHVSAVLALVDLSRVLPDRFPPERILTEIENLKRILPLFEKERFVLYSVDGVPASGFYLRYMILQLSVLAQFDPYFGERARHWKERYLSPLNAIFGLIRKVCS